MNGVLVFMITGAMLAVLAHMTEYIYALCIKQVSFRNGMIEI